MSVQRATVVMIGPLPSPLNGMTVMSAHALEALRAGGLTVIHCDTSDHRKAGNVGRLDPVNVILALVHGWKVFWTIARYRPTIVYLPIAQETLGFLRDALFFLGAHMWHARTVVHFHGGELRQFYSRSRWPMKLILRQCLGRVSHAIVLTESLAGEFDDFLPRGRVSVVQNGIPSMAETRIRSAEKRRPRVVFLSNLNPRKGVLDVLSAAPIVVEAVPEVEIVIAGEWPSHSALETATKLAERMGVSRNVTFLASTSGLRKTQLLRSADVFAFPPRRPEGQSLVVLEAMSLGVPIVSTALGGLCDTIVDGKTGVVVRPEDPPELGRQIVALLLDPQRRASLGSNARAAFQTRWEFGRFSHELSRILTAEANAGGQPARGRPV